MPIPTGYKPAPKADVTLTLSELGMRALVLGGLLVGFVVAMLSPAADGLSSLPDHMLGKLQGDNDLVMRPTSRPMSKLERARVRQRAVQFATAEVGVKEWPTLDNRGARIVTYRRAVTGRGENPLSPEPWCADFVSWAWKKAGFNVGFGGHGSDYVPELVAWARLTSRWHNARAGYRPKPGDLVVYRANGLRYGHIGLIAKVRSGRMHTIEGNYQDQVFQRVLKPWHTSVQGFISPV